MQQQKNTPTSNIRPNNEEKVIIKETTQVWSQGPLFSGMIIIDIRKLCMIPLNL